MTDTLRAAAEAVVEGAAAGFAVAGRMQIVVEASKIEALEDALDEPPPTMTQFGIPEPRGCPTPGACSCGGPQPQRPALSPDELREKLEELAQLGATETAYLYPGRFASAARLVAKRDCLITDLLDMLAPEGGA